MLLGEPEDLYGSFNATRGDVQYGLFAIFIKTYGATPVDKDYIGIDWECHVSVNSIEYAVFPSSPECNLFNASRTIACACGAFSIAALVIATIILFVDAGSRQSARIRSYILAGLACATAVCGVASVAIFAVFKHKMWDYWDAAIWIHSDQTSMGNNIANQSLNYNYSFWFLVVAVIMSSLATVLIALPNRHWYDHISRSGSTAGKKGRSRSFVIRRGSSSGSNDAGGVGRSADVYMRAAGGEEEAGKGEEEAESSPNDGDLAGFVIGNEGFRVVGTGDGGFERA